MITEEKLKKIYGILNYNITALEALKLYVRKPRPKFARIKTREERLDELRGKVLKSKEEEQRDRLTLSLEREKKEAENMRDFILKMIYG